ncbi:hypothetical protein [Gordonia sihwensis]|uniref:hypothetical protein n=1 Tax=Gordonia TaxID=2053 RepID=UPI0021B42AC7|nr:hypothetical protein [Gordonia sihwensis]
MSQTDYLDRHEQKQLRDLLARIPGLVEDLINVQTRQARIAKRGMSQGRRPKKLGPAIPYHIGASDAADNIHATLVGWVRVVLDQRGGEPPADATISLADWLRRNMTSLALCEGSREALREIEDVIRSAVRVVDIPPDDHVIIDPQRVEAANRTIVTRDSIDTIAPKLGEMAVGLNARRMRTLEKAKVLKATGTDPDTGTKFYRLGDVLHAHVRHRSRT